jgi:hypothetical protein
MVLKLTKWIPDKVYLEMVYPIIMHKKLNLVNPQSFSEKTQWLKLYDYKEEYDQMADKVAVRKFVKEKIGEQYLVKRYGVYEKAEDIPFNELPKKFVLKCSHDSGSTLLCTDKEHFEKKKAIKFLNQRLRLKFYLEGRENVYKNVSPRIICEELLGDGIDAPADYKVFCFAGCPKFIQVDYDRFKNHTRTFYNTKWEKIKMQSEKINNIQCEVKRPCELQEMLLLAEKLSNNMKFIRVDFYIVDGKIYFGELTFYHDAGYSSFLPNEMDKKIADMIICK